jgi:hypothetical protein
MDQKELRTKIDNATKQIHEMQRMLMDYIHENEVDENVTFSFLISMMGIGIAGDAADNIPGQDQTIDFIGNAIRLSLAENGYRPITTDMHDAIPPWEKN